jgi:hypothetical protein
MTWKHLRVANEKLPPLLINANFSHLGYIIKLTDLSRIWVEVLSRDDVTTRARRQNCSIDPGEDNSQQKIFLDKLESALSQDVETNISISATNDGTLKLHLEAPLPSPLPAFEWEVELKRSSDSNLGAELVSPLLRRAHSLNHRMEQLIAELQAKDKVIAKITDRLETSGHDLTAVFPGVSNVKLTRSISQLEQLGRHIRGLGKFDEETWKAQLNTANDTAALPQGAEDAIFASLSHPSAGSDNTDQAAIWWQQIPVGRHIDLEEERLRDAPDGASRVSDQLMEQDTPDFNVSEHDGFQRQATPPRLRSHSPPPVRQDDVEMGGTGEPAPSDEDSTEDEDDLDRPSQRPSASRKRTTREARAAQVAQASGESPPQCPPPASKSVAQPSTTHGPFTHEEDTEDDDDDDLDGPSQSSQKATSTSQLASRQKSQTPQQSPPTTTTTKSSPKKTPGKLGDRLPTKPASRSSTPPSEEESSDPPPTTNPSLPNLRPRAKAKLGMIGGAKAKTKAPSPPPPTAPATSTAKNAAATARHSTATPEPQPRPRSSRAQERQEEIPLEPATVKQTDAERADAKREALKRELEQKAKAPVKKKIKF